EGGVSRVIVYGYHGLPIQPVPQDEDEHEPRFIQAHDPDGDTSGNDADDEDEDDEDEDEEDEEEHLAPADSDIVAPTKELVFPLKGTKPVIPPSSTNTCTVGARITIRIQTSISLPP
ncbi:hypothetical protein Tco_1372916, partial [Tanacetum coccineum]